MTIRRLRKDDDLGDLIALSRAFFNEYEAHHEELFRIDVLRDEDIVGYFGRTVDSDDGATFIEVQDGRTVGYMTVFVRSQPGFYRVKQVGAILGLMVHRDHRRKGVATRLLAEAKKFFTARGVRYFTVYTASENDAAVKFYERNGMRPLHVTLVGETGSGTEVR
jgi:ribosomal protein S18 acetylase RimI-like enzyme